MITDSCTLSPHVNSSSTFLSSSVLIQIHPYTAKLNLYNYIFIFFSVNYINFASIIDYLLNPIYSYRICHWLRPLPFNLLHMASALLRCRKWPNSHGDCFCGLKNHQQCDNHGSHFRYFAATD